ncbi:MAG: hypothetical protein K0R48_1513 [Gammaproteobacteria bacterium]|jgi:hypothetical protein|nr:hypothetical protein [Gammaproteobacteria bacterium]
MNIHRSDLEESVPRGLLILSAIGILVGLTDSLSYLHHYSSAFIVAFINAWGTLAVFSYNGSKNIRLSLSSAFAALCISIMISFLHNYFPIVPRSTFGPMLLNLSLAIYMIHCFHWAYHRDNSYHYQYSTLFYTVWNTFCLLIFSCVFSGLAWSILYLSASLFTLVHVNFLKDLLLTISFTLFICPFLLSVGIFLGRQRPNIIDNLRWLLLQLFRYLYPFLAIMVLAFLIISLFTLVFLGSHPFFQHTILFSSIALLGIIFINSSYQDGNAPIPYSKYTFTCIKTFMLTLPLFAISASVDFLFNLRNTLYYPINLTEYANRIFLITYTVAYAIAVLYSRDKKPFNLLPKINISLAVAFILVALSLNNALLFSSSLARYKKSVEIHQVDRVGTLSRFAQKDLERDTKNTVKALKASGITWATSSFASTPLILGYRGKDPLYACRMKYNHKWVIGELFRSKCNIIIINTVKHSDTFEVLTGPIKKIVWTRFPLTSTPIGGGEIIIDKEHKEVYYSRNYICRTIYNNQIYIGRYTHENKPGASGCFIAVDSKAINVPFDNNWEFLGIDVS